MSVQNEKLYPVEAMTGATSAVSEFVVPKSVAEWQTDPAGFEQFADLADLIETRTSSEGEYMQPLRRDFAPLTEEAKPSRSIVYVRKARNGEAEIILTADDNVHKYSIGSDGLVVRSDEIVTGQWARENIIEREEGVPVSEKELAGLRKFIETLEREVEFQAAYDPKWGDIEDILREIQLDDE